MRTWKANWCHTCGGGANFGDQLTPALLTHYGIRHQWTKPNMANLVVAGSILSKLPASSKATVIGTGLIRANMRRELPHARILALRGPLTAERIAGPTKPAAYGDPGILVDELMVNVVVEDTGTVIAPHYVDKDLWPRLKTSFKNPTPLAVTETIPEVLRTIAGAKTVHTSSLHIFITADLFGVPVTYYRHPDVIGGGFKFDDYASGMAGHPVTVTPGVPYLTDRNTLETRRHALRSLILNLK